VLEALSAEALKLRTHKATWFLVWLFPIAFTIIFAIAIGAGMAGIDEPSQQDLQQWIENTAAIWFVPGNTVGRYLIAAFVAVVFAGEYGWNTWKLIVPHRSRSALIAAKYALVLILFATSFVLTALLTIFFSWLDNVLTGDTIPAGITAAALFGMHGKAALAALGPILVTVAYASLAAILTRSTIAALVISIIAISLEQLIYGFGPMMYDKAPALVSALYHGLPGHHLANVTEWLRTGAALAREFPGGRVVALGWAVSAGVLLAWVAALVAAVFAAFRRQDIN
jgi:hypothetical protein